jgi:predicted small lipoprotein YifL
MHRFRSGIAGIVLAGALAGCGSTVDEGPHEFKPTDTTSLNPLMDEMKSSMKKKDYAQKAVPPDEKKSKESKK